MERKDRSDIERYSQVRNLPTPVRRGMYELAMKAFESGCPNFEQPMVLRGLVTKPFKDGRTWVIKSRGSHLKFRWFMNEVPTDVVDGKRYTIVGDMLTANLGKHFILDDCVLIPKHTDFMKQVKLLITQHVLPIGNYIDKPKEDTYFVKE